MRRFQSLAPFTVLGLIIVVAPGLSSAGPQADEYALRRRQMVAEQLAVRDIKDARVLETLGKVPRHLFVPPPLWDRAYEDYPLPIGDDQTISQPYIVALMTQSLDLKGGEKVLEVGTGSGYQAAVLAGFSGRVFSIEINPDLASRAARLLAELGYANITVKTGDGFFGWPAEAPFDDIMVTCAVEAVPPALLRQLREGGRLILPLGAAGQTQVLTLVTKTRGRAVSRQILDVRFVPMTGAARDRRR